MTSPLTPSSNEYTGVLHVDILQGTKFESAYFKMELPKIPVCDQSQLTSLIPPSYLSCSLFGLKDTLVKYCRETLKIEPIIIDQTR